MEKEILQQLERIEDSITALHLLVSIICAFIVVACIKYIFGEK